MKNQLKQFILDCSSMSMISNINFERKSRNKTKINIWSDYFFRATQQMFYFSGEFLKKGRALRKGQFKIVKQFGVF